MREEDHDSGARHVMEALQSGLAGIAGGGGEDDGLVFHAGESARGGHKLGQHAERHVLKGGGGPVEELQHIVIAHRHQRRELRTGKTALIGAVYQRPHIAEAGQQAGENLLGLAEGVQRETALHIEIPGGDLRIDIESAVRRKAAKHRFRRAGTGIASGGLERGGDRGRGRRLYVGRTTGFQKINQTHDTVPFQSVFSVFVILWRAGAGCQAREWPKDGRRGNRRFP